MSNNNKSGNSFNFNGCGGGCGGCGGGCSTNKPVQQPMFTPSSIPKKPMKGGDIDPNYTDYCLVCNCLMHMDEPIDEYVCKQCREEFRKRNAFPNRDKSKEPKNNDGRRVCYWCLSKTVRKVLFHTSTYDICPACLK